MSLLDPRERSARGAERQGAILGVAPLEPRTPYEAAARDFLFAEVWTRPGLDLRSRFLITLANACTGDTPKHLLDSYVHGALTLEELTLTELREAALHIAVYGGWSRGANLDAAITRVSEALRIAPTTFAPIRAEPWDPEVRRADGVKNFTDVMTFPGPKPHSTAYLDGGILNFVFGEMWRRPGLDERARRWLTLVGVADSSSEVPIRTHIYAAMKSGNATPDEMNEFVLQYAVHSGWPKASVIQGVVLEMADKVTKGLPYS